MNIANINISKNISKDSVIQNIFQNKDLNGKDLNNKEFEEQEQIKRKILSNILTQLPALARHQNYFSRNLGISIPKSLQIMAIEVADIFNIPINEKNLAKIIFVLCKYKLDNNKSIEAIIKTLYEMKNQKPNNEIITAAKMGDSESKPNNEQITAAEMADLNYILKATKFIIGSPFDGWFSDIIKEHNEGIYKNSYYTNYNRNDLLTDEVRLFDKKYFKLISKYTHVLSSIFGLGPFGADCKQENYKNAIFQLIDTIKWKYISFITDNDEAQKSTSIFYDALTDLIYDDNLIATICPPNKTNRQGIIDFFKDNDRELNFNINNVSYKLKPVMLQDKNNGHYFVHWEFSATNSVSSATINTTDANKENEPKYMFHFNGNAEALYLKLNNVGDLIVANESITHILVDYPNKGFNKILNPQIKTYSTSFKGASNPHLLAFNYYKKIKPQIKLGILAYSIGNIVASQFINQIVRKWDNQSIFFMGIATAKSFRAIAIRLFGKLAKFLSYIKMIGDANVEDALKNKNVTAVIFNEQGDNIIRHEAQINNNIPKASNSTVGQNSRKTTVDNVTVFQSNKKGLGHGFDMNNNKQFIDSFNKWGNDNDTKLFEEFNNWGNATKLVNIFSDWESNIKLFEDYKEFKELMGKSDEEFKKIFSDEYTNWGKNTKLFEIFKQYKDFINTLEPEYQSWVTDITYFLAYYRNEVTNLPIL
jgi:hypothetical protein